MDRLIVLLIGEALRGASLQNAEVVWRATDAALDQVLATHRPRVIVTSGEVAQHKALLASPFNVRRNWLHFSQGAPDNFEAIVLSCFSGNVLRRREGVPALVSVFTPTYQTGALLYRAYDSLRAQTYPEWEWVLLDDSRDEDTWKIAAGIAADDPRVSVYRGCRNGVIGDLKAKLCGLCRGDILAELDHDDELAPDCLAMVVDGFRAYPDSGFAYTDWCEVFEGGGDCTYPKGWAFGYGAEEPGLFRGQPVIRKITPPINAVTSRHIVSSPNHVRAWRRDFYHQIGGHNRLLHVADDYELCVRSLLHTRPVHVRAVGYKQYMSPQGKNTQRVRNAQIQRLTDQIWRANDRAIHERLLELGLPDPLWNEGAQHGDFAKLGDHERLTDSANYVYDPPSIVPPCASEVPGAASTP